MKLQMILVSNTYYGYIVDVEVSIVGYAMEEQEGIGENNCVVFLLTRATICNEIIIKFVVSLQARQ